MHTIKATVLLAILSCLLSPASAADEPACAIPATHDPFAKAHTQVPAHAFEPDFCIASDSSSKLVKRDGDKEQAAEEKEKERLVYVVGAGPVGLMIAVQYLDANESKVNPYRFVFIEKRATYSRLQQLAFWEESWKLLPYTVKKKLAKKGCIRKSPFLMGEATCYCFPDTSSADYSLPEHTVFNFVLQASYISFC
jgi:hypothetical protein